ncbi:MULTISPECIES: GNAT family N-acetyltransferase [Limibacillus]|jgi:ribosomal-protein-alanine N-acetyltransferase|uniref:Ribosomal-protein-alanine N-acetyltransferase n=1 Tax=Limibacillus halophilus TaxID=1579333 RepID=A0A839SXB2_9PROT|nr:GNAT family protein [Limibacillus halophilus]MBB3066709.1 ribosomal-protein-alanine N-acetyltransferase [Limibacillus halophilus]
MSLGFFRKDALGLKLGYGRVYLRAPRARDYQAWTALRAESRDFLAPWEPTWARDALSRSAFRQRLRHSNSEAKHDLGYAFFLFRRDDDALLGGVTLRHLQRGVAQSVNLGYWIGARHARRGYMTEGLRAASDFAFDHCGLHRIEAACLPENRASSGLLEKLGFQREGCARAYLRINGSWHDHLLYALLRDDPRWPDL